MDERSATERFEAALAAVGEQPFVLRLYVAGATPGSQRAIANLREICETQLAGRYQLEVIDVYQRPQLAVQEQIVATPTLVRLLPQPVARIVGDLSDGDKVLIGLDLVPRPESA